MKELLLILFGIFLFNCSNTDKSISDLHKVEIELLKTKNDSLIKELEVYKNEVAFKDVFFKHYTVNNSQFKKGTKYEGEFVFTPLVENYQILFGTELVNGKKGIIKNPDTLNSDRKALGAFRFELDVINDTTNLYFMPIIKDKSSTINQKLGYNGWLISDKYYSK